MRAKFKLDSIERTLHGAEEMHTLKLSPVYDPNPESENGKFWRWTPSGSISLGTVNAAAVAEMKLGAEYFIDFIPAAAGE